MLVQGKLTAPGFDLRVYSSLHQAVLSPVSASHKHVIFFQSQVRSLHCLYCALPCLVCLFLLLVSLLLLHSVCPTFAGCLGLGALESFPQTRAHMRPQIRRCSQEKQQEPEKVGTGGEGNRTTQVKNQAQSQAIFGSVNYTSKLWRWPHNWGKGAQGFIPSYPSIVRKGLKWALPGLQLQGLAGTVKYNT